MELKVSAKFRASKIAVITASFLAFSKLLVGLYLSSLVILASALDNLVDVLMSSLNYFSIKKASQPPDVSHSYGHEKVESLASMIQGFFILFSLFYLVYLSISRIAKEDLELKEPLFGALAIFFSLIVTVFLARFLKKEAKKTSSVALKADALHYSADVYTNLAALFALLLISFTGLKLLDPIFALLIALYLIKEPLKLIWDAAGSLIDKSLSSSSLESVSKIVFSHVPYVVDYHNLRSREAGSKKMIDFHMVICRQLDFQAAHQLVEELEKEVAESLDSADVLIHPDPCPGECELNWETCEILKRKENGSLSLWRGALKGRLHHTD